MEEEEEDTRDQIRGSSEVLKYRMSHPKFLKVVKWLWAIKGK